MTNPGTTVTDERTARADEKDAAPQACDVCTHSASGHDHISRRYCAATLANALSRNCICP